MQIEFRLGILALLAGGVGQLIVADDMFPAPGMGVPAIYALTLVFFLPVIATWLPIFCNQPLFPFQTYVRWCLYMSCCSVGASLLFEFFHLLGLLPIRSEAVFVIGRIMMHLNWLSFFPQIHYWILYRRNPPTT